MRFRMVDGNDAEHETVWEFRSDEGRVKTPQAAVTMPSGEGPLGRGGPE